MIDPDELTDNHKPIACYFTSPGKRFLVIRLYLANYLRKDPADQLCKYATFITGCCYDRGI